MIRHVVLMQFRPGLTADDSRVLLAVAAEQRLAADLPDGGSWRFGPNLTHRDIGADFVGTGDFDSLLALDRFLADPAHRNAVERWHGLATFTVADLDLG